VWWASQNCAFIVALGSSKKQVNFVIELNKQHIDCAQHLHLQLKCCHET